MAALLTTGLATSAHASASSRAFELRRPPGEWCRPTSEAVGVIALPVAASVVGAIGAGVATPLPAASASAAARDERRVTRRVAGVAAKPLPEKGPTAALVPGGTSAGVPVAAVEVIAVAAAAAAEESRVLRRVLRRTPDDVLALIRRPLRAAEGREGLFIPVLAAAAAAVDTLADLPCLVDSASLRFESLPSPSLPLPLVEPLLVLPLLSLPLSLLSESLLSLGESLPPLLLSSALSFSFALPFVRSTGFVMAVPSSSADPLRRSRLPRDVLPPLPSPPPRDALRRVPPRTGALRPREFPLPRRCCSSGAVVTALSAAGTSSSGGCTVAVAASSSSTTRRRRPRRVGPASEDSDAAADEAADGRAPGGGSALLGGWDAEAAVGGAAGAVTST